MKLISVEKVACLWQSRYVNCTVQYSTVQYSTVQYCTVQYSTVQCHLRILNCIALYEMRDVYLNNIGHFLNLIFLDEGIGSLSQQRIEVKRHQHLLEDWYCRSLCVSVCVLVFTCGCVLVWLRVCMSVIICVCDRMHACGCVCVSLRVCVCLCAFGCAMELS